MLYYITVDLEKKFSFNFQRKSIYHKSLPASRLITDTFSIQMCQFCLTFQFPKRLESQSSSSENDFVISETTSSTNDETNFFLLYQVQTDTKGRFKSRCFLKNGQWCMENCVTFFRFQPSSLCIMRSSKRQSSSLFFLIICLEKMEKNAMGKMET